MERMLLGRKAYKWVLRDWVSLIDSKGASEVISTMRFTNQIEPQVLDGPSGKRLLVLAPHPDDEVIGPGGTLIRSVQNGKEVTVLYITSGARPDAEIRETEAKNTCANFGFASLFLKEYVNEIRLDATAKAIAEIIVRIRPDAIFLPFILDDNDDHRRVNQALMLVWQQNPNIGVIEVWGYQVYTPLPGNIAVDISGIVKEKSAAIRSYASQMLKRDWAHFALGLNAFNCRLLHGRPDPCFIESFVVLPSSEYVELCERYFTAGQAYYVASYSNDI